VHLSSMPPRLYCPVVSIGIPHVLLPRVHLSHLQPLLPHPLYPFLLQLNAAPYIFSVDYVANLYCLACTPHTLPFNLHALSL
jgi:hypothetical protein